MGIVLVFTNRSVQATAECERALALDRNLAALTRMIGQSKLFIGRGEETEAHVQEALRLSPRDPWVYTWLVIAGIAKAFSGGLRRPSTGCGDLLRPTETIRCSRFILAAALANLGRVEEARSEVKAGLALDPQFTIASFHAAAWSDNPVYLAKREQLIDGMRKAGVPEG